MFGRKNVKEENVISRWGVLLVGLRDMEEDFFEFAQEELGNREWVYQVKKQVVGSFLGSRREYLSTAVTSSLMVYVGAEPVGKDLYISWNLAAENTFGSMDFNDVNSARALASCLNYAVQSAADRVLDGAGSEQTLNREAEGQLGRLI
jgi:hypothetical protein